MLEIHLHTMQELWTPMEGIMTHEQQARLEAHLLAYICPDCGHAPEADGICLCDDADLEQDMGALDAAELESMIDWR